MNAIQQIIGWMPALLQATGVTLALSVTSVLTALVLAVFLALGKISKNTVLRSVCGAYIFFFRGTPLLVQIFLFYFAVPVITGQRIDPYVAAVGSCGINSGAYVAEIIRSGIMSIDPGQMEAGRSLGLNYMTTMFEIIIPQAIRSILPALGNEFIMLLKDSSLITVIGGKELLYAAQGIMNRTYEAMFPLFGVALIYLVLVMIFTWLLAKFERRLAQSDR